MRAPPVVAAARPRHGGHRCSSRSDSPVSLPGQWYAPAPAGRRHAAPVRAAIRTNPYLDPPFQGCPDAEPGVRWRRMLSKGDPA